MSLAWLPPEPGPHSAQDDPALEFGRAKVSSESPDDRTRRTRAGNSKEYFSPSSRSRVEGGQKARRSRRPFIAMVKAA